MKFRCTQNSLLLEIPEEPFLSDFDRKGGDNKVAWNKDSEAHSSR
jgi:hypothetical protein